MFMWTTREELMDLRKVRKSVSGQGDADLWIKNWEELHELAKRGIFVGSTTL